MGLPGLALGLLLVMVSAVLVSSQSSLPASSRKCSIQGFVHESSGNLVFDATVRLKKNDTSAAAETRTNREGVFEFTGLEFGTYTLAATKAGRSSQAVTVVSNPEQKKLAFDLVLENPTTAATPANLDFADEPKFTIAGVTDWTAAGGHGSDAVLRTSEAITHEALVHKPKDGEALIPSPENEVCKESESQLHASVLATPDSFEANHQLGEFYFKCGRKKDAISFLQSALKLQSDNRDVEYELAEALKDVGDLNEARMHVRRLVAQQPTAASCSLEGELDERLGDPLDAVREFEQAARLDSSEVNIFNWGSELLRHRAIWQARDVFTWGAKVFPKSTKMMTALGAALFAGALYNEAAQQLCEVANLNPADKEPYILMGKIELAAPDPLPCVQERLALFVQQYPTDSQANYFYGMAIWKQNKSSMDRQTTQQVKALLSKAVDLDSKRGDGLLQLGNLEFLQKNYEEAIGLYRRSISADAQLIEAHYRLGMAYDRIGEKAKAREEFQLHDELKKQQAEIVERQRRDVKQFVVTVLGQSAGVAPR